MIDEIIAKIEDGDIKINVNNRCKWECLMYYAYCGKCDFYVHCDKENKEHEKILRCKYPEEFI